MSKYLIRGKNEKIYQVIPQNYGTIKKKNTDKVETDYIEANNLNRKVIDEGRKYLFSKSKKKYAEFQIFKNEDDTKKYYLRIRNSKIINYTNNNDVMNIKSGDPSRKVYNLKEKKIRSINFNSNNNKHPFVTNSTSGLLRNNNLTETDTYKDLLDFLLLTKSSTDLYAKSVYVSTDNFDPYLFDNINNILCPIINFHNGKIYAIKVGNKRRPTANIKETENFNDPDPDTEYYLKKFSADRIVMYNINDRVIVDNDSKKKFNIKSFVKRNGEYYAVLSPGDSLVSIDRLLPFDPTRNKIHPPPLYKVNEWVYRRDNARSGRIPDVYKIGRKSEENVNGNHTYTYGLIGKNGEDAGEYLEKNIKNLENGIDYSKKTSTTNKFTFGAKDALGLESNIGLNHFKLGTIVYIKSDGISKKYKVISANGSTKEIQDISDKSIRIKMNKKYLEKVSDKVNKGNIVDYTNKDGTTKKGKILSSESGSRFELNPLKWKFREKWEPRKTYYTVEGAEGRKFTASELTKNIDETYSASSSTSSSTVIPQKYKVGMTIDYRKPLTGTTETDVITRVITDYKKNRLGYNTTNVLGYKYKVRRDIINERDILKVISTD